MYGTSKTGKKWRGASVFVVVTLIASASASERAGETGWIVQFGTAALDRAAGVAVQGRSVFVAGVSQGTLPDQTSAGGADAFVARFNSRGELRWIRQFGTPGADNVTAGSLRAHGRRIVVGGSVTGALPGQTAAGGTDAFIRAYDRTGDVLWTLQFGTPLNDQVRGLEIADDGSIVVVGQTDGQLTEQPSGGSADAFVMRLDADGTVQWLRQLGTRGVEAGIGVAVTKRAIYVAGVTDDAFPGQANAGDFDNFVARLTPGGDIDWVTQFGTPALDAAWKLAVVGSTIFVSGHTLGAFDGESSLGDFDGFVAGLRQRDGRLDWVRQFGTPGCDQSFGLAANAEGAVAVGQVGGVRSPQQTCVGNADAFARKYDADGNVLWTTQFGTPATDNVNDVDLKASDVYLAGVTQGSLPGQVNAGLQDAFVMRVHQTRRRHNGW